MNKFSTALTLCAALAVFAPAAVFAQTATTTETEATAETATAELESAILASEPVVENAAAEVPAEDATTESAGL